MSKRLEVIGLVATFYKTAGGKVRMDSLTTLTKEDPGYGREPYISRSGYDVDYSREFGYLFHQSSGGGEHFVEVSGIYWVSGEIEIHEQPCQNVDPKDKPPWKGKKTQVIRKRNRTRRLARLPKAIDLQDGNLLDWLENNAIESDAVWCSICRDYFPGANEYDMCDHVWWCEKTGWYSTPDERCTCKSHEECRGDE